MTFLTNDLNFLTFPQVRFIELHVFHEKAIPNKGPEWNPLLFAHPSTLDNEESEGCSDPAI